MPFRWLESTGSVSLTLWLSIYVPGFWSVNTITELNGFFIGPTSEGIEIEKVGNTEIQSVSLAWIYTQSSSKLSLANLRIKGIVTVNSQLYHNKHFFKFHISLTVL